MREWICIYSQLTHTVVQQKQTQHCKAITLQVKINFKKAQLLASTAGGLSIRMSGGRTLARGQGTFKLSTPRGLTCNSSVWSGQGGS